VPHEDRTSKVLHWTGRGWYAPRTVPLLGGLTILHYEKVCPAWRSAEAAQEIADARQLGDVVLVKREESFHVG